MATGSTKTHTGGTNMNNCKICPLVFWIRKSYTAKSPGWLNPTKETQMITLTPEDAELVADAVLKRSSILVDAFVKRMAARERVQAHSETAEPRLLTYAEVGEKLKRTYDAVKMMVHRKELK